MFKLRNARHCRAHFYRGLSILAITFCLLDAPAFGQSQREVQEDIERGEKTARQVEEQMGLYDSPVAREYVAAVGQRLVAQLENNPYPFRFDLVNQEAPNAFALPGGRIYVSRGLLTLIDSEDELAGVLGHEISHVLRRHSSRRSSHGLLGGLLMVPGSVVGSVVGEDLGRLINAPIATIGKVSLASYSRSQETEADRLGTRLAASAGYDPAALGRILTQMEKVIETLTGKASEQSFFDSHPTTPKRLQTVEEESAKLQWTARPGITAPDQVTSHFEGVHVGVDPRGGVLQDSRFLHPVFNFAITFPAGWNTANNPTTVGAVSPEEDALAALSVLGRAVDPADLGAVFIDRLKSEYGLSPSEAKRVDVGDAPGFLVTLTERSREGDSHLYYLWVAMGGKTFQLIAAGADRHNETLRDIALSLRPLSEEEAGSINQTRLHIVRAQDGETLEALSARSGNRLKLSFTALVNRLSEDAVLSLDQPVRTAQTTRFVWDGNQVIQARP